MAKKKSSNAGDNKKPNKLAKADDALESGSADNGASDDSGVVTGIAPQDISEEMKQAYLDLSLIHI